VSEGMRHLIGNLTFYLFMSLE